MTSVIYEEKRVGRLVLLDQLANFHHEFQVGVLGGNGEDVSAEGIVFAEAFLQVLEFRQYEEIIGAPVQKQCLDLLVPLRRIAAIWEGSRGGLDDSMRLTCER
jgi:hypothetical protein